MSNTRTSTLKKFMSHPDRCAMELEPTWHSICIEQTGVARPGKTKRDKANGHVPYRPNRRFYNKQTRETTRA